MPPQLALIAAIALIVWLFATDPRRGNPFSDALWVPLLWFLIVGSRPVSLWFAGGQLTESFDYQEGSPLDRNLFLLLIFAGIVILSRREIRWDEFMANNRWLVLYVAYLGFSVLWADYPFVSLKRWFKDLGNIIMVLVVLTESDPAGAVRSVLVRCAYVLVPLSVVLIKYFPDLGRYYNSYVWTYSYSGVAENKNLLGGGLIICSLGLFWSFLELRRRRQFPKVYWGFLVMVLYLFYKADSSTAVACSVVGIGLFLALRAPGFRSLVRRFGLNLLIVVGVLFIASMAVDLSRFVVVDLLGRDMSLTGRTVIWERVLKVEINPFVGTGFYSFWLGNRIDWEAEGWLGQFNEAHNGYLETYLNSGLVGLALLVLVLLTAVRRLGLGLARGGDYGGMRYAFLAVALIYNITESAFNRMSPLWLITLLAIVHCAQRVETEGVPEPSGDDLLPA